MRIFSYDGIIAQIIRFFIQLFLLNLFYVLCCLPVFTFGAATTALYSVFLHKQEDERLVRRFFQAFRAEFGRSTKIWIIFLLLLLALVGDYYCLCAYDFAGESVAWVITVIATVLYLSIAAFVFPLQAHYDNPIKVTVRNAAVLGVGMILLGVLLNVIAFLPVIVFFFSLELFSNVMIWWLPVWCSLAILINSKLLGWVFRKIQPEEEKENEA